MHFHVGNNLPGCLPEEPPACLPDVDGGKAVWVDEIESAVATEYDNAFYGVDPSLDDAVEVAQSHAAGELGGGATVQVAGRNYWIEPQAGSYAACGLNEAA